MTDRDHFAAAALTGLVFAGGPPDKAAHHAYQFADAMLAERAGVDWRSHSRPADADDIAALQRAMEAWETTVTEPMLKEKRAEVPVDGPVAWAVTPQGRDEEVDCEAIYPEACTAGDVALDAGGVVIPLYRHPQPTLTDEEREAIAYFAKWGGWSAAVPHAEALRALLERRK